MRRSLLVAFGSLALGTGIAAAQGGAKPQPIHFGGLTGALPTSWISQPAEGQFRLAQYAVPKAQGDGAAALFIVFHFGAGGGGSVEDNLKRWAGMMRTADGGDASKDAKTGKTERPGVRITTFDLAGTYMERPFPMSDQSTPRPNYRLLAAVVETTKPGSDGPYFLRLVGPAKSVNAAKPAWDALLASLKAE